MVYFGTIVRQRTIMTGRVLDNRRRNSHTTILPNTNTLNECNEVFALMLVSRVTFLLPQFWGF